MIFVEIKNLAGLRKAWPIVKPGVEELLKGASSINLAEDVYHYIRNHELMLTLIDHDGELGGFAIWDIINGREGRVAHCYMLKTFVYNLDYWPAVVDFAKKHSCRLITATSHHKHIDRLFKRKTRFNDPKHFFTAEV